VGGNRDRFRRARFRKMRHHDWPQRTVGRGAARTVDDGLTPRLRAVSAACLLVQRSPAALIHRQPETDQRLKEKPADVGRRRGSGHFGFAVRIQNPRASKIARRG